MALIIGSADHRRRIHGHKQRALICRIPHVACGEPGEPLVSGAILAGWAEWAEWADSTRFSTTPRGSGYDTAEVDAFRQEIRDTFLGVRQPPLTLDEARDKRFRFTRRGYDVQQVDAFLDQAEQRLAAMESTDRPAGPLVSGAIAGWAEWADSTRFSTSRLRVGRYDTAEVDAFREAIRDSFLGVRRSPLTWPAAHGKQFPTHWPGYDVEQVDAFLDKAEPRLAAMRATDKGAT
jgi:DivIVA domain-containing protein